MSSHFHGQGCWQSAINSPAFSNEDISSVAERVREPAYLVQDPQTRALGVALGGDTIPAASSNGVPNWPLLAVLPPLAPWAMSPSRGRSAGRAGPPAG